MDTPPADEMRLCSSCGSWIRRDRTTCPWCNAEQTELDDVAAVATADEPPTEITRAVPRERAPRPRHPWRRALTIALLAGLMLIIGATGVGAYQGWQDRRHATQREAIAFFERGQELLTENQYDLAIANLREALRLEPNFVAAAQLIQIAEQRSLAPPPSSGSEAPAPTPLPLADNDRLFAEAAQSLAAEEWEIAAATFDMLSTQSPDFRTEEVLEGLFRARRGAAAAALEVGDLDAALRHIDQALAIRPEDQALVAQRRVLSAYRTAQRAIRSENWTVAADQLRTVYLVDPDFMDVEEQLARAHLELAAAFAARDIWCQAAQQYRASNSVLPDRDVAAQATAAERRCSVRATAAPLRPTITPAPNDEGTPLPTWTPRATGEITATVTFDVPTATPTVGVIVQPTWTPQPTQAPQPTFAYYNSWLGERINDGCGGHYIIGTTRAPDGAPISDVTILAVDDYGNRYTAVSKVDPLGSYNIPIPAVVVSYRVSVVRGDQQVSPVITVTHSERFATAAEACHIIDWTQR